MLQQHFGIEPAQQRALADRVCDALASVVPDLIHRVTHTQGFGVTGSRMLWEWGEGIRRLSDRVTVAMPDVIGAATAAGIRAPIAPAAHVPERVGGSPLLAKRRKEKARPAS